MSIDDPLRTTLAKLRATPRTDLVANRFEIARRQQTARATFFGMLIFAFAGDSHGLPARHDPA